MLIAAGTYLSIERLPALHDLWRTRLRARAPREARARRARACAGAALHRSSSCARQRAASLGECAVAIAVLLAAAVLVDSKPPPASHGSPPTAAHPPELPSRTMLVLTRADVEELLDLDELVGALARAHEELSSGAVLDAAAHRRVRRRRACSARCPPTSPSAGLGCKLVTALPGNTDRDTHQAAIILFDPENGTPIALMDGTYITAMRTAAAAALATRLLARADAKRAHDHRHGRAGPLAARAFAHVRDYGVRLAGRDRRGRASPASSGRPRFVRRRPCAAPTSSRRRRTRPSRSSAPSGSRPGTHVTSVGYNAPGSELDPATRRGPRRSSSSRASPRSPRRRAARPSSPTSIRRPSSSSGELVSGDRRPAEEPRAKLRCTSPSASPSRTSPPPPSCSRGAGAERGLEIELEEMPA